MALIQVSELFQFTQIGSKKMLNHDLQTAFAFFGWPFCPEERDENLSID